MSKQVNNNCYLTVNQFEKLTFEQAKKLYTLYVSEVDIEKKKELRSRIIQGTLHMVLKFIKNNQFDLLHSSSYDMDDIINTAFEIWIRKIDEGVLLESKIPSQIFRHQFYYDMAKILVNDEYVIDSMNCEQFIRLLSEFIDIRNQNNNFNYQMFINWIQKKDFYRYLLKMSDNMFADEYILLDGIYQSFHEDNVDIAKSKLDFLFKLFVQNGLEHMRYSIYDIKTHPFENEVLTKELYHDFLDVVFSQCELNEIQKEVLKSRFGIDDRENQTLKELAKEFDRSKSRINAIEKEAIRKLKINSKKLKHFND